MVVTLFAAAFKYSRTICLSARGPPPAARPPSRRPALYATHTAGSGQRQSGHITQVSHKFTSTFCAYHHRRYLIFVLSVVSACARSRRRDEGARGQRRRDDDPAVPEHEVRGDEDAAASIYRDIADQAESALSPDACAVHFRRRTHSRCESTA